MSKLDLKNPEAFPTQEDWEELQDEWTYGGRFLPAMPPRSIIDQAPPIEPDWDALEEYQSTRS